MSANKTPNDMLDGAGAGDVAHGGVLTGGNGPEQFTFGDASGLGRAAGPRVRKSLVCVSPQRIWYEAQIAR